MIKSNYFLLISLILSFNCFGSQRSAQKCGSCNRALFGYQVEVGNGVQVLTALDEQNRLAATAQHCHSCDGAACAKVKDLVVAGVYKLTADLQLHKLNKKLPVAPGDQNC